MTKLIVEENSNSSLTFDALNIGTIFRFRGLSAKENGSVRVKVTYNRSMVLNQDTCACITCGDTKVELANEVIVKF